MKIWENDILQNRMSKMQVKEWLNIEKQNYPCMRSMISRLYAFLCQDRDFYVFKYIKLLRYTEFYFANRHSRRIYQIPYMYYKHRKNKLGRKIGIDMGELAFEQGLYIAHCGIIVGSAKVGKNCRLHGQNCIGSNAQIGDNCELWVGARVFGPAKLANNITVAAGAVVVDSFEEEGITVGGVPARKIK